MAGAGIELGVGPAMHGVKPIVVLGIAEKELKLVDLAAVWGFWAVKVVAGTLAIVLWRLAARAFFRRVLPILLPNRVPSAAPSTPPPSPSSASTSEDPSEPYPAIPGVTEIWTTENLARVAVYIGIAWIAQVTVPWAARIFRPSL
ncbi:hypothetical protein HDU93_003737 [Gonapodya sp. JEL0774]|nr:hypothetical protein HDU93_003737 [Gonapodya sp. JEL0774]